MSEGSSPQNDGRRWIPPPLRLVEGGLDEDRKGYAYVQIRSAAYQSLFERQLEAEGYTALGPGDLPPAPVDARVRFSLILTDNLLLVSGARAADRTQPRTTIYALVPDLDFAVELAEKAGADLAITVPMGSWWGG
ncbi:MAG: hypothetical protein KF784_12385 [Fimbriimonadaceae bacterium]|nr:hypothetical protein [Fimbriimonadaceae bacterium]